MNFMADFNEDAFPEHINGDAYTEVPIACPSDSHFAWDIAKVNVTSMTSGFDAMDQFLSLNNFCTSLETSTTKMMLPPSYLPGTWVYISQLQERMARLEHELAAIRSLLAATPRKVDTENVLALSEVATERPSPVAANTNSLTSLRQGGSRKVDRCMKRKYNRRPKVRGLRMLKLKRSKDKSARHQRAQQAAYSVCKVCEWLVTRTSPS